MSGGAGRFTTVDTPMPTPGAGEALLRVRRVGICGTDLHIFQGHLDHRVPKGGVIGHETFAEVVDAPQCGDVDLDPTFAVAVEAACDADDPVAVVTVTATGLVRNRTTNPESRVKASSSSSGRSGTAGPAWAGTGTARRSAPVHPVAVRMAGGEV